ncbi:MAG: hypothetical protein KAG28_10370 [Cocleimonas sp.]|nr:hypothetical protein [Cocleimonas sp.]
MNKLFFLSAVSVISIGLVSAPVLAKNKLTISIRLDKQAQRIQKGSDKGQLTIKEEKALNNEQQHIKRMIKKLTKKNIFTVQDKKKIHTALDHSSVNIFKKRYNKAVKIPKKIKP